MLIVMGGLPGTGKTTLARLLAARIGAVHLRVDTIEQAIVRSGLAQHPVGPVGYVVGYALAEEHLRQGLTVIAESVNLSARPFSTPSLRGNRPQCPPVRTPLVRPVPGA
ncbi:AAA family ATPase, partial [Streptomyces olivaceoviridis]